MTEEGVDRSGGSGGGLALKVGIVVVLVIAVGTVMYAKKQAAESVAPEASVLEQTAEPVAQQVADAASIATVPGAAKRLPRLVDLGADKCIPCKMMAPILEELKKEYAGRLEVQFIDVWKNPEAGEQYGINLIPTQIFYDASGKERFRHEGFFSKEDILTKWEELGVDLGDADDVQSK